VTRYSLGVDSRFHLWRKDAGAYAVARPSEFRDMSKFRTADANFVIRAPLADVWRVYATANPLSIWSGPRARVVAVHVPSTGVTLDRAALATGWRRFERGMNVFLDMAVLPVALVNFPAVMVGLQIVRLDARAKVVEFRYLERSLCYGRQTLTFHTSGAVTTIAHRTWYRGVNALVESTYPFYHEMMLRGMHEAFRRLIERD
jgi:hypothetical protein